MIKRVFRPILRTTAGWVDSIFARMNKPLRRLNDTSVRKRASPVNASVNVPGREEMGHQMTDPTGLKVGGEGEWRIKKHGQARLWPLTAKRSKPCGRTCGWTV